MARVWAVGLVVQRRFVGLVEPGPHKDGNDTEISVQFTPISWGHGFAREAVGAVLQHALGAPGMRRIIAETQSANAASCQLLRDLWMVEIARVQRFGSVQIIFATQCGMIDAAHGRGDRARDGAMAQRRATRDR